MDRYLVYQPNHGVGMELHIFETAVRLAQALERILVVPRLPRLETNNYERGLDDYFELPEGARCVSHSAFLTATGGTIDFHVKVIPKYRPEYRSQINRSWHPTWLNNIDRSPYFGLVGCKISDTRSLAIERELAPGEAARIFEGDFRTLAISYLNGLLVDAPGAVPVADDDFNGRMFTPPRPLEAYFRRIQDWAQGGQYDAIHVREGYRELAWDVSGVRLPSLEDFVGKTRPDVKLYVATDVNEVFQTVAKRISGAGHARRGIEQIDDATLDIAACIGARRFIGTHFSTFSQYISHARRLAGHDAQSTILLRDAEHAADHVYKTYDFGGGR